MNADFWTERTVTARKLHRCESCRETIKPGDKYVRVAQKYEGDFSAYPMCVVCHSCIPQCDYSKHEVEYNISDMLEWYREELRDVPGAELPEPEPVDDRTLPMFGAENAPRVVKPTYREELLRLCNLLRKERGMTPLEVIR